MYLLNECNKNNMYYPYGYINLNDGNTKKIDFSAPLVQMALYLDKDLHQFILSRIKQPFDVEDIYQESLLMLAQKHIEIKDDLILKKYIFGCVNIAIKRYFSKKTFEQKTVSYVDDTILNAVNPTVENSTYDFKETFSINYIKNALHQIEGKRYKYGCDIFLIIYVRLIVPKLDTAEYIHIISLITGIDKKQLTLSYKGILCDDNIMDILGMLLTLNNAIDLLSEYVYCSESIKQLLS